MLPISYLCTDLQPNETKLLQFVGLIDSVVKEISILPDDVSLHNVKDLLNLEMKIVRTILPVKVSKLQYPRTSLIPQIIFLGPITRKMEATN